MGSITLHVWIPSNFSDENPVIMMGADSRGRKLLFPKLIPGIPKVPIISGAGDHEKKRKIAVKCLEMEEMLEKQGHSQSEIETKVASFRSLLLQQLNTVNNNTPNNNPNSSNRDIEDEMDENEKEANHRQLDSDRDKGREKKKDKKKKKHQKETKNRKKKKGRKNGRSRSGHRYSSPSYSDYEPDNAILR